MRPGKKRIFKIASAVLMIVVIIASSFLYIFYQDVKKKLIEKATDRASSVIGHKVDIGNISFSLLSGINVNDISVKNPEGFPEGQLLGIKNLNLNMKFRELFHGIFYFRSIWISSPELSLIKDSNGKVNVSDKLMAFLTKKSTTKYQVDELRMTSGKLDINEDKRFRSEEVNLKIKNLSSEQDVKTLINLNLTALGRNKFTVEGWAYPKTETKKFSVSLESKDISLTEFRDMLNKYKIDTDKIAVDMKINADGDMKEGVNIRSGLKVKHSGYFNFTRNIKDIELKSDSFFNIQDGTFAINEISLNADEASEIHMKGIISDIFSKPHYTADIKIRKLDIGRFNFLKDIKVKGEITSENINIKKAQDSLLPELFGSVNIINAGVKTKDADIGDINAGAVFSYGKKVSVKTDVSAKIFKVKDRLDKPAGIRFSADLKGSIDDIAFIVSAGLLPIDIKLKADSFAHADDLEINTKGRLKAKKLTAAFDLDSSGIKYNERDISSLKGSMNIKYDRDLIALSDLKIDAGVASMTADQIVLNMPVKDEKYTVSAKNMHFSYPEERSEVKKIGLDLNFKMNKEKPEGNITFSAGEIVLRDILLGSVAGKGNIFREKFDVELTGIGIAGGNLKLNANGISPDSPYPLKIKSRADNIDAGIISKAVAGFIKMPYSVAGSISHVDIDLTADSAEILHGKAEIKAEKISILKAGKNKSLLRNGFLKAGFNFIGKEIDFTADAGTGSLNAKISGTASDLAGKDREINIRASLPETKAEEIRSSFWDIFPDKLLYAGMDGSISADISADYKKAGFSINGDIKFKDLKLEGENGEYSAGPVNGELPLSYGKNKGDEPVNIPVFERSKFEDLKEYYSQMHDSTGDYKKITVGSLSYGFRFIEDIDMRISSKSGVLNITGFSGNIFGGKIYGTAYADFSDKLNYRAGILLDGLSMTSLCNEIEPIKGYITGRVDGVASFKGYEGGVKQLIGKADFWTYSKDDEKTKISKEFLLKIGGPAVKTYLGDRRFNKGTMKLYIKEGLVIFDELEISNRNFFGITDLSVKVAPFNNKISIDHLMWTMTEAAQRAKSNK